MFARLKLCSYQKKPNDVTIFIYLCIPQEISKSLFVKILLRYRFDCHQSQCHQEVLCHVTIIIALRLEIFSVLLKFILLEVIVQNNPYSFMEMEIQTVLCYRPKISTKKIEKWKYKLFCAVVRKYQPKK